MTSWEMAKLLSVR